MLAHKGRGGGGGSQNGTTPLNRPLSNVQVWCMQASRPNKPRIPGLWARFDDDAPLRILTKIRVPPEQDGMAFTSHCDGHCDFTGVAYFVDGLAEIKVKQRENV